MKTPFTQNDGLLIQAEQIAVWSRILNPHALQALREEAVRQNNALTTEATGYDVWRGTDIDTFLANLARRLPRRQLNS